MRKKRRKLRKILYYPQKGYRSAIRILRLLAEKDFVSTQQIAISAKTAYDHHGAKVQMEYLAKLGYCEDYGVVSNPNHICDNCKKTDRYLVSKGSLDTQLKRLEKNRMLREENKNKPNFDPRHYFDCREGYVLGRLVGLTCKGCGKYVEKPKDEEYKVHQDRLWTLTANGRFISLVLLKGTRWYDLIKNNIDNKVFELLNVLLQCQEKHEVDRLIKKLKKEMEDSPNLMKIVNDWYDEMFDKVMSAEYNDELYVPLVEYKKKYYGDYLVKLVNRSRFHR